MIIDGALDLVNLSTDIFQGNESSLVGRIKSIEIFQSTADQSKRHCRTRIQKMTETGIVYDAETMNSQGRVIERIQGVEKFKGTSVVSSLSEPIWELLRENPIQSMIKRLLRYPDKLIFTQVPISVVRGALEHDEKGLLSSQLTKEEKRQYSIFKYAKRRLEWLSGRIVSKAAVRIYLDEYALQPTDITIGALSDKSPRVLVKTCKKLSSLPYISISHSNDIAISVASQTSGIGIDVENINDSIIDIAYQFSTDKELKQVIKKINCSKSMALTMIWAMKEASCKACRNKDVLISDIVLNKIRTFKSSVVCDLHYQNKVSMKSVSFESSGYVYAVSRFIV